MSLAWPAVSCFEAGKPSMSFRGSTHLSLALLGLLGSACSESSLLPPSSGIISRRHLGVETTRASFHGFRGPRPRRLHIRRHAGEYPAGCERAVYDRRELRPASVSGPAGSFLAGTIQWPGHRRYVDARDRSERYRRKEGGRFGSHHRGLRPPTRDGALSDLSSTPALAMTKPILVSTVMLAIGGGALVAAVAGEVRLWKPAGISSPQFESHPAFDPRTGDFISCAARPNSGAGESWSVDAPEPDGLSRSPQRLPEMESGKTRTSPRMDAALVFHFHAVGQRCEGQGSGLMAGRS